MPESADLVFWGEWEAESDLEEEYVNPPVGHPRYLYRPYYRKPQDYSRRHNTDPVVFGSTFYYSNCRQYRNSKRGRLQSLADGSIILFGSRLNGQFALDTVFVVAGSQDLDRRRAADLCSKLPDAFVTATLLPLFPELVGGQNKGGCSNRGTGCRAGSGQTLRLYHGATHQERCHGMFSFFPCRRHSSDGRGFPRPVIDIDGMISHRLTQNYKITPLRDLDDATRLWRQVVGQVLGQGLLLGVSAELPPCRGSA